jgi:S-adenosylmethionine hydrolase
MSGIISLLTDFGGPGAAVAEMKATILGLAPRVRLVDIGHTIAPQNLGEGARALGRSPFYFPAGTIHIFVVDPGVGTRRRPMAAQLGPHTFVGPDNGVLTLAIERAEAEGHTPRFVHLDRPAFWRPRVSNVFHGRDIFAPVAAHLANGVPFEAVGTAFSDALRLSFPKPQRTTRGLTGEVSFIVRHFGNIFTNIDAPDLEALQADPAILRVRIAGIEIQGLVRTFGDRAPGELVALIGSDDELIIAEVNGHAADRLKVKVGDPVEISAG